MFAGEQDGPEAGPSTVHAQHAGEEQDSQWGLQRGSGIGGAAVGSEEDEV